MKNSTGTLHSLWISTASYPRTIWEKAGRGGLGTQRLGAQVPRLALLPPATLSCRGLSALRRWEKGAEMSRCSQSVLSHTPVSAAHAPGLHGAESAFPFPGKVGIGCRTLMETLNGHSCTR